MIVALKWPLSLVVAMWMLPQAPSAGSWQGYAAFAAVLGIMMTLLELGKRMLDLAQDKRRPPVTINGMGATLKQIADTLSRVESGLNATTTALAVIQQMNQREVQDSKAMAILLIDIQQGLGSVKQTVDRLVA